jgi:hypothetical protein
VSSGTETPTFCGNLLPPYFLFRSEDDVGGSGSRTGETVIVFLTANTLDCLAFWSANNNNNNNNNNVFPRDMVCLGNICINTLHKGAKDDHDDDDDDNDDDDDDNNNNNNNNNNCYFSGNCFSAMSIYGINMDVFM